MDQTDLIQRKCANQITRTINPVSRTNTTYDTTSAHHTSSAPTPCPLTIER